MRRPRDHFCGWISVVVFLVAASPAPAFQADDAPPPLAPEAAQPAGAAESTPSTEPAPGEDGIAPPPSEPEVIKERYPGGELRVLRHAYKDDDGKLVNHGEWSWWTPGGTKTAFGEFVHGKRHGRWTRWFAPGEGPMFAEPLYREYVPPFISVAEFVHGKLDGVWTITDGRKQLISEWAFVDGVPHGPWRWWDGAGEKLREVHYVLGALDGKALTWGPQGKVEEEYIEGRRKYPRTWWFPGPGRKKHVEGWHLGRKELNQTTYDWWEGVGVTVPAGWEGKDQRHGKWTWWYPNGQIETEGQYAFDKRVGTWTWYDPEGKVIKATDFTPAADTAAVPPADAPPADAPPSDVPAADAPPAGAPTGDAPADEGTVAPEAGAAETGTTAESDAPESAPAVDS